jgi:hypothetical protein
MEYSYHMADFDPDETIDLPDEAEGLTLDTFGGRVFVRYLLPVATDGGEDGETR